MLLWITPAYRLQSKIPIFHCHDCGNRDNLTVCVTCGERVCPSCRCGTGELSDGYECVSHWRNTLPSKSRAALEQTLRPARRSMHEWLPWLVMGVLLALSFACMTLLLWS